MRTAFRTFVLVAPLAASVAFAEEGQKVPLALQLTKGATAEFEQTSITSQTMTREGAPMQNSVTAHRALTVTVASVAADGGVSSLDPTPYGRGPDLNRRVRRRSAWTVSSRLEVTLGQS